MHTRGPGDRRGHRRSSTQPVPLGAASCPRRYDAAGDAGSVARLVLLHERVVHPGDRGTRIEVPVEQLSVIALEALSVLSDDLEVHYRLAHVGPFRAGWRFRVD